VLRKEVERFEEAFHFQLFKSTSIESTTFWPGGSGLAFPRAGTSVWPMGSYGRLDRRMSEGFLLRQGVKVENNEF